MLDAWRRRGFVLLVAPGQIDEVAEVLRRPKIARRYPIAPADRDAFLELLRTESLLLPRGAEPGVCRDPDDDALLGCAVAGGADYVVSGDNDLLAVRRHGGVTILTAREFLTLLGP